MAREYLQRHCRNGLWLHQRLADTSAIDIALLGSSRTMCAVSDQLLEASLSGPDGAGPQVANLGLCRYGRTLTWTLGRRLLARPQAPAWLIIEVRVTEDRFSHPDFPYLASGGELLGAYPFWHQRYFEQLGQGLMARFQDWRQATLGLTPDSLPPYAGRHGFVLSGNVLHLLPPGGQPPLPLRERPETGLAGWRYQEGQRLAMHYLHRTVAAAQAQGTRVGFLYLPGWRNPAAQRPLELATYEAWGPVWMPPPSVLDPEAHWMDPDHLNEAGARVLTDWLARQIQQAEGT